MSIKKALQFSRILKMSIYKQVLFSYIRASSFSRLRPLKQIRFEIDIAGHCNLNCVGCNHFSPLAREEFIKLDTMEKDFSRLSRIAGRDNSNIDLMGGEPLLHPEIIKVMEITRKYFDGPVNIVTNGILLVKMKDDFWRACRENNIRIIVTSYPINLDRGLIKRIAKKHSVKIKIRLQLMNTHTWCRLPKDIAGSQDILANFKLCLVANFCVFLRDGKLSTCCLPLVADRFNNYFDVKFHVDKKNDYIDIYSVENKEDIYNFLCKPIPFCRYCKIKKWEVGIPWGISKKEINEWID